MIHDLPDGAIRMTVATSKPAIYLFLRNEQVVYIGQTSNLSQRLVAHSKLKKKCDAVFFLPAHDDIQIRREQEAILINRYNPIHNSPVRGASETNEEFEARKIIFRKRHMLNAPFEGTQVRLDDDLEAIVVESARVNLRSVTGEANYALRQHYRTGPRPKPQTPAKRSKKQSS